MRCVAVPFAHLSGVEVHDLLRLRQDVFVVEQRCAYADVDGRDVEPGTRHVLLQGDEPGHEPLLGCARVLDDADRGGTWRIGRLLLHPTARGQGLADVLVRTALAVCPGRDVVLDAQAPLAPFYAGFGFAVDGPGFVEDDIPHVPMRRPAGAEPQA